MQINLKQIFFTGFLFFILVYFIYHFFQGDRGFYAYFKVNKENQEKTKEEKYYADIQKELEKESNLLRSEHLDPDILDEKAKEVLNFVSDNEFVLIDR